MEKANARVLGDPVHWAGPQVRIAPTNEMLSPTYENTDHKHQPDSELRNGLPLYRYTPCSE